ncbi:MAG: glycosyltransferase [Proteobacteria bacterium]|nr:glycosyltransferase [Pseudomonadota bacterium]
MLGRDVRTAISAGGPVAVFLDGLDELPAGDATLRLDLIDALANLADEGRASPAGRPPQLRVTCRTSELPDDFVHGVHAAWDGDIALLRLEPLDQDDVLLAVSELSPADVSRFAAYIDGRGLRSMTSNPMTLRMLALLFESDRGNLPGNLAQVYRASTSEMLVSVRGLALEHELIALQRALRILGRLAAVCVLSGRYVLWTGVGTDAQPPDAIAVTDASGGVEEVGGCKFHVDDGAIRAVMRPGFFERDGTSRLAWPHRSFAEFLAADYLAEALVDRGRLVDLLTIRDAEGARVVPRLREVASWLAGMDAEVRRSLVRSEPVLLLQSDVASADAGFKAALTTELLDRLQAGGSSEFRFDQRVRLDRLSHSGLSDLLRPWIRGKHLRFTARSFAVDLARRCAVTELFHDLLTVASDKGEPAHLRAAAAAAAGEANADAPEIAVLRGLLESSEEADPQDELKGVALRTLWPRHLDPEQLFGALTPPRDDTLYGWYKAFIYGLEPSSFDAPTLVAGLRWMNRLRGTYQSRMVFQRLMPNLIRTAWAASEDNAVRAALADVLVASASDYEHPTRQSDLSGNDPDKSQPTAVARERMFVDLSRRAGEDGATLARWTFHGPIPVLVRDDLPWLLGQAGRLPGGFLTDAICYLAAGKTPDEVARLWELRDGIPEVAKAIERLFTTDLLGPAAGWARATHRRERDAKRLPEPADLDARIAASVATCSETPQEWWRLNLLLLAEVAGTGSELAGNLAVAPGWLRAGKATRAAIVRAAYRYLAEHRMGNLDWLGTNQFNRVAAGGYRALRLLSLEAPSLYETIPLAAWAAWTPAILWFPNNDPEDERAARASIAARAHEIAPDEFAAAVRIILERGGSAYDLARLLTACLDEQLCEMVWQSVLRGDSDPPSRRALVALLTRRQFPALADWVRDLLADPSPVAGDKLDGDALEVFAPAALLEVAAADTWPEVWERRLLDRPHAVAIWRAVSVGHSYDLEFLSSLPPAALADLYAWIGEVHGNLDLPKSGHVTADHELSGMRRRIPALLAAMPEEEAAAALSRLALRDTEDVYLRTAVAQSRENRLARAPGRLAPEEVLGALGVRPAISKPSRREEIIAAAANVDRLPIVSKPYLPPDPTVEALPLEDLVGPEGSRRSFLLVATEWRSGFGGVSSLNRELACALAAGGHRVCCVLPDATAVDVDTAGASGVKLLRASPMVGYSGQELLDACPRPTTEPPDFVLGHDHVTGRAALRIRNEYFPDAAYVHVLHTIPMESEAYKSGGSQSPAARGVTKDKSQLDLCDAADLALVIGPKIRDRFSPHVSDPVRMHQLVPGLSPDLLAMQRGTTLLPRVLWVGRGEDPDLKGLPAAMHLAALLQNERLDGGRQAKMVVRGLAWDNLQEEVDRLRNIIQFRRIALECFPYTDERADLVRDYRSCMCLVMPSATEAFGMVALEAIAAGLPVIVSSYSGIGQFLLEQETAPAGVRLPDDTVLDVFDEPAETAAHWVGAVLRRLRDPTAAFGEAARLREGLAKTLTWSLSTQALVGSLERAKRT